MHIEPGIVTGAKLALGYVTAAGSATMALKVAADQFRLSGLPMLAVRAVIATALVFTFFQILPKFPVGVSEVHFILGSTLFLLLGAAPAAIGLAAGLLLQGMFFAPLDLPQYGMNVTTLLVPLFALTYLARRIIAPGTAYADLTWKQVTALSLSYQGGIVAWVAFWAVYGQGATAATLSSVMTFGSAYMLVVLIEPLVDLAVLATARASRGLRASGLAEARIWSA